MALALKLNNGVGGLQASTDFDATLLEEEHEYVTADESAPCSRSM